MSVEISEEQRKRYLKNPNCCPKCQRIGLLEGKIHNWMDTSDLYGADEKKYKYWRREVYCPSCHLQFNEYSRGSVGILELSGFYSSLEIFKEAHEEITERVGRPRYPREVDETVGGCLKAIVYIFVGLVVLGFLMNLK